GTGRGGTSRGSGRPGRGASSPVHAATYGARSGARPRAAVPGELPARALRATVRRLLAPGGTTAESGQPEPEQEQSDDADRDPDPRDDEQEDDADDHERETNPDHTVGLPRSASAESRRDALRSSRGRRSEGPRGCSPRP